MPSPLNTFSAMQRSRRRLLLLPPALLLLPLAAAWFTPMLSPGQDAPAFTLEDDSGRPVSLSDFRGRPVVLVFYPGDSTMVCTAQLCEFRDQYGEFAQAGAAVLGVNPFGSASHQRFSRKHGFQFPLLVDKGLEVSERYGCKLGWGPIAFVNRTVYVIGADGKVAYARRGKPAAQEVLAAVRSAVASASG